MPNRWYYLSDGQPRGPVSVEDLKELAATGRLQPTDRVCREGMDRWAKAKSVRGLFVPLAADAAPEGPIDAELGDHDPTAFDFFGRGPAPEPAAEEEPRKPLSAFNFTGFSAVPTPDQPPPLPPPPPPEPKPSRKSAIRYRPPPPPPPPEPLAALRAEDSSFRFTAAAAAPAAEPVAAGPPPFADVTTAAPPPDDVPLAMPVDDEPVLPLAAMRAVPPTKPQAASAMTGLAVDLLPDDTAALPGGHTTLRLQAGWLAAQTTTPDGPGRETYLRLSRLSAAVLDQRPEAGPRAKLRGQPAVHTVLSFHADGQTTAVVVDGDPAPARAFLEAVLRQAEG